MRRNDVRLSDFLLFNDVMDDFCGRLVLLQFQSVLECGEEFAFDSVKGKILET